MLGTFMNLNSSIVWVQRIAIPRVRRQSPG